MRLALLALVLAGAAANRPLSEWCKAHLCRNYEEEARRLQSIYADGGGCWEAWAGQDALVLTESGASHSDRYFDHSGHLIGVEEVVMDWDAGTERYLRYGRALQAPMHNDDGTCERWLRSPVRDSRPLSEACKGACLGFAAAADQPVWSGSVRAICRAGRCGASWWVFRGDGYIFTEQFFDADGNLVASTWNDDTGQTIGYGHIPEPDCEPHVVWAGCFVRGADGRLERWRDHKVRISEDGH